MSGLDIYSRSLTQDLAALVVMGASFNACFDHGHSMGIYYVCEASPSGDVFCSRIVCAQDHAGMNISNVETEST